MYFIPIFSVVLIGMPNRRVPALAAKVGLVMGFVIITAGYFLPPFSDWAGRIHEFHFLGLTFAFLIVLMLGVGAVRPLPTPWTQEDVQAVDMTPWKHRRLAAVLLVVAVLAIYAFFADVGGSTGADESLPQTETVLPQG